MDRSLFRARVQEIEEYFQFLVAVDAGVIHASDTSSSVDAGVIKTLKAVAFLLLYNLVEAAMRTSIESIFDDMKSEGTSFEEVTSQIRYIALRNLFRRNAETIERELSPLNTSILWLGFEPNELFGGNVDARKIRDIAKQYGFSSRTNPSVTRGGHSLLKVKSKRNSLAHGNEAFHEVGRDYTVAELVQIKTEVVAYIDAIVANIRKFVNDKEYMEVGP